MTVQAESARRYLLGAASEDECSAIEQDYLSSEDAIDRIAAAEDDLIEDYLAGQLTQTDRDRFERGYLAAPHHRVRVEAVRQLMAERPIVERAPLALPHRSDEAFALHRPARGNQWLALAASLLLVAVASIWFLRSVRERQPEVAVNNPPTVAAPAPRTLPATPAPMNTPRVFAVTVSPAVVRSGDASAAVVVPAGTDVVALQLAGDGDIRTLTPTRVSIRTVAGTEIWRGSVATPAAGARGTVARVEVPADRLPADDYLLTLYGSDRSGVEREWSEYYLRIAAR